jgi:hypothetical protein
MNRMLIGTLSIVNQLLALFFIISGVVAGIDAPFEAIHGIPRLTQPWGTLLGGILGLVAGIIVAGLVCGFVAAIVTISRELVVIRDRLAYPPVIQTAPRR